jgi:hypothetical protein
LEKVKYTGTIVTVAEVLENYITARKSGFQVTLVFEKEIFSAAMAMA